MHHFFQRWIVCEFPRVPPSFSEEVAVDWILVPVIVKSKKGYLRDIPRQDFELRVDGKPVRFQDFEQRGEASWSLVLLQDLSGSMGVGGRLAASQEAARYFLDRGRPGDEFALASFASGSTSVDVPFTEDMEALRESVASWEGLRQDGAPRRGGTAPRDHGRQPQRQARRDPGHRRRRQRQRALGQRGAGAGRARRAAGLCWG